MAAETFKKIKCKVYRADYPDDQAEICVNFNAFPTFRIIPGQEVSIPQPVYDILKNATYPANRSVEGENGMIKTEVYDRPRFTIQLSDIETNEEANARIAALALEQGKTIDELKSENERLQADLAAAKEDEIIPDASDDESGDE